MIDQLKGRWGIFKFKWVLSKLKWPMIAFALIGLYLAWNGDYGYVPAEYCSLYPYITYGIVVVPLLAWIVEMEIIGNNYTTALNEIRRNYGIKIKT